MVSLETKHFSGLVSKLVSVYALEMITCRLIQYPCASSGLDPFKDDI